MRPQCLSCTGCEQKMDPFFKILPSNRPFSIYYHFDSHGLLPLDLSKISKIAWKIGQKWDKYVSEGVHFFVRTLYIDHFCNTFMIHVSMVSQEFGAIAVLWYRHFFNHYVTYFKYLLRKCTLEICTGFEKPYNIVCLCSQSDSI